MAKAATSIDTRGKGREPSEYELPLTERMRTFMRLEFLYLQLLYNSEQEADWATRAALSSLLETLAILGRGDVRSDTLKELERQLEALERFRSRPGVDTGRLSALINNLARHRDELRTIGANYIQTLKDNEFLSAIKHRSSIPGGTCEFDLPEYSHWLRQPWSRRQQDLMQWLAVVRPVCDAVVELLWLIREKAAPQPRVAANGMYQHTMKKDAPCHLLRVTLPPDSPLYPEISGSQHRVTVRFLKWSDTDRRAVQADHDVDFDLSIS